MNYQKHYDRLIETRKERESIDGYTEMHHIVPRSLGGSDDAENMIALTAKEHYIAHMLLARIHGGAMWLPIMRMSGNMKIPSYAYEHARKRHSQYMKENNPSKRDDVKEKIRQINIEQGKWVGDLNPARINHPRGMLDKTHSEDTKKRMSESKRHQPKAGTDYTWITPLGEFKVASLAAEQHNIPQTKVRYRCFSKAKKWAEWKVIDHATTN